MRVARLSAKCEPGAHLAAGLDTGSFHAPKVAHRRPFSTAFSGSLRPETLTASVNREPAFGLADVRTLATSAPALLPAASAWARRFHPRTTLARAAAGEPA